MERNLARTVGVLRRLLDALLLALILVVLVGVVLGKLVPLTGRETIVIGGRSMEPTLPLGAAIVNGRVDPATLAAGQIVSLKAGPQNTIYTHRIVAVVDRADGRWVQTKGDANPEEDPTLVPSSAIVGRTELIIPLAGYLIALLSLPAGVMFIIGLAASLLAGAWLLESVESDGSRSRRAAPVASTSADRSRAGEPMAARRANLQLATGVPDPLSTGAPSDFHGRPTVAEQLARSRETRVRRNRWGSNFPRRGDRPRA
jgi:signal peptidase I